ncbi:MAG: TrmH family RNA methyltransferase [Fimbriimonadales bacterium]
MGRETPGGIEAMRWMEEVLRRRTAPAQDPGLRKEFASLPRAPIRIICCDLDKGINHGNILRIADCFRLEQVIFSPVSRRKEKDFSGGFAALKWQPYKWQPTVQAVSEAKDKGYRIYGLAMGDGAKPLRAIEWQYPCAIVLGQELTGIDADVLELCDDFLAIPMYGMFDSLNVAVSCALAVESCQSAFVAANPSFLPARTVSRTLLSDAKGDDGEA